MRAQPQKIVEHFDAITEMMCEMCAVTGSRKSYINIGLRLLLCLENVPSDVKLHEFGNKQLYVVEILCIFSHFFYHHVQFIISSENCVDFFINADCVSSQLQILHILCSYVESAMDPIEQLWPLYKAKLGHYTFDAIKSIEWSTDCGIPLASQIFMLDHINHMRTALHNECLIYSELIESIKFDDRVTITCVMSVIEFLI